MIVREHTRGLAVVLNTRRPVALESALVVLLLCLSEALVFFAEEYEFCDPPDQAFVPLLRLVKYLLYFATLVCRAATAGFAGSAGSGWLRSVSMPPL